MVLISSASTILGVKVDSSAFVEKTRTFDHDFPDNWNVDPVSGRELWHKKIRNLDFKNFDFSSAKQITVTESGYKSGDFIVGYVLCGGFIANSRILHRVVNDNFSTEISYLTLEQIAVEAPVLASRLSAAGLKFERDELGIHLVISSP